MRTLRSALRAAALAATCVLGASTALARGPKAGEMPTVEEIVQQARQALDAGAKGPARPQDPVLETIDAYKDRSKTPLTEFKPLVDCINDPKETPQHRESAEQALVIRFAAEDIGKPEVRAQRRSAASAVIELMKVDPKRDPTGLELIAALIDSWWRNINQVDIKFVKTNSIAKRRESYERLKKMIAKGEN